MDAAVEWGANGELYIFKGSMFWRYNNYKKSIDPGYPKTIQSVLPKLPSHIEAALQWKNGKTYFFKGAEYYTLDDASVRIRKGYPKSISTYWMGCSPVGLIGGKISPYRSSLSSIATRSVFPHAVEFVLFAVFIITSVVQFHWFFCPGVYSLIIWYGLVTFTDVDMTTFYQSIDHMASRGHSLSVSQSIQYNAFEWSTLNFLSHESLGECVYRGNNWDIPWHTMRKRRISILYHAA